MYLNYKHNVSTSMLNFKMVYLNILKNTKDEIIYHGFCYYFHRQYRF